MSLISHSPKSSLKKSMPFALTLGATATFTSSVLLIPLGIPLVPTLTGETSARSDIGVMDKLEASALSASRLGIVQELSVQDNVRELRALSGLTTDQIARLIGVSRRSVHNWISGLPMSIQHQERLSQLLGAVQSIPNVSTPEERRSVLLSARNGTSMFHRLLDELPSAEQIVFSPLSTSEKLAL